MADEADRASDYSAQREAAAIRLVVASLQAQSRQPSLTRCLDCGKTIPEKRREVQPGCEYCVQCQVGADKSSLYSGDSGWLPTG